jgi:hypothetical protein
MGWILFATSAKSLQLFFRVTLLKFRQSKNHTLNDPARPQVAKSDRFGLNLLGVNYSLSKKKRWLLASYFEQNGESYQHPDLRISTALGNFICLATSDFHFLYDEWRSSRFVPKSALLECRWGRTSEEIDCEDGLPNVFQNRRNRGQVKYLLRCAFSEIVIYKFTCFRPS